MSKQKVVKKPFSRPFMVKKVRLLAVSDLHGDTKQVQKLAERAAKEHVDVVILCGDITGYTDAPGIIKPFTDKKKHVLIVPGNHDSFATTDFLASFYKITNLHGYAWTHRNIGFFGAGGADIGPGAITEKELLTTLKKAHSHLKGIEKKIMITHMHPSGSVSEFSGFPGSKAISKMITETQPTLVLHGHIHEAAGLEHTIGKTRVINVGREGVIIEL